MKASSTLKTSSTSKAGSKASSTQRRIASMDQFRGYTVAGMFVVNFLSSFAVIHPLLKHNNTYFSDRRSPCPRSYVNGWSRSSPARTATTSTRSGR